MWSGPGVSQEALIVQQASNDMVWNGESTSKQATDYLNYAKQHQTSYTASDATPGAPLLQGDALVAYKNLKREKNCKGMESECESMSEMDVGDVCICVSSDCKTGTNWPQWH